MVNATKSTAGIAVFVITADRAAHRGQALTAAAFAGCGERPWCPDGRRRASSLGWRGRGCTKARLRHSGPASGKTPRGYSDRLRLKDDQDRTLSRQWQGHA